jgi:hypothetical protein
MGRPVSVSPQVIPAGFSSQPMPVPASVPQTKAPGAEDEMLQFVKDAAPSSALSVPTGKPASR